MSKEMQARTERNNEAKSGAYGKHSQVRNLVNLEQDELKEKRLKEKMGNEEKTNLYGKQKLRQHDVTNLEQDEAKERKVKQKTIPVATNQQSENKPRLAEKSGHGVSKHNSQTQAAQRKSKQSEVTVTGKTDVHGSGKHAQVGKTCESSARRKKVMQSLGLIAPSGSPFRKHGPVNAQSCEI